LFVTFSCCNLFGNTGGDSICGVDDGGNFSLDPRFCDVLAGDFRLHEDSPCLPGNHPDGADCETIGALGVGCGMATPIGEGPETTSWTWIKGAYR
jgi:hypothetical protein